MSDIVNIINRFGNPEPALRLAAPFKHRVCSNCVHCIKYVSASEPLSKLGCKKLKRVLPSDLSKECVYHTYEEDDYCEYGRPEFIQDIFDEQELNLVSSFIESHIKEGYELVNISDTNRFVTRGNSCAPENGKMVIMKLTDNFKKEYIK